MFYAVSFMPRINAYLIVKFLGRHIIILKRKGMSVRCSRFVIFLTSFGARTNMLRKERFFPYASNNF